MSGALSNARLGRLHDVMAGYVERGEVPGVVTLVSRRGEVHRDAIGRTALDGGVPMRPDTLFRIASMTKPIAAVAAMILVEEAKLRLDDPVDRWLPELADRRVLRTPASPLHDTVPASRPITLRDLLTMRAGYGLVMEGPGDHPIQQAMDEAGISPGATPPALEPDELIQRFADLPLIHHPGERWLYHTSFEILAVLIARAAGMPFEEFLQQRIFAPLGMSDTAFSVPAGQQSRLATCYESDAAIGGLVLYEDDRGGHFAHHAVTPSGGSGLVATVDDYLAFGRMILSRRRHGTERILARPTVQAMTTDQLTPAHKAASPFFPGFWDSRGWGFGVSMITRRDDVASVPGRFGWDGGFGTSWSSDPEEDLVGVLMIQRLYDPIVAAIDADFRTLVYQAIDD